MWSVTVLPPGTVPGDGFTSRSSCCSLDGSNAEEVDKVSGWLSSLTGPSSGAVATATDEPGGGGGGGPPALILRPGVAAESMDVGVAMTDAPPRTEGDMGAPAGTDCGCWLQPARASTGVATLDGSLFVPTEDRLACMVNACCAWWSSPSSSASLSSALERASAAAWVFSCHPCRSCASDDRMCASRLPQAYESWEANKARRSASVDCWMVLHRVDSSS